MLAQDREHARDRRNPPWARDELMLALDLYLREGQLDHADPRVVELSTLLNALPIHTDRPGNEKFRNANGVAMKLANFAALDPRYLGAGLRAGGRQDADVWAVYSPRPDLLHNLVGQLRERSHAEDGFPVAAEEDEDVVVEGRLLYRLHRARERDREIIKRKKQSVLARTGCLSCEVCDFDFKVAYGDLGDGFSECHHVVPLSIAGHSETRTRDLAIVCSNCHRMLHSRLGWTTPSDLRGLVVNRRMGQTLPG